MERARTRWRPRVARVTALAVATVCLSGWRSVDTESHRHPGFDNHPQVPAWNHPRGSDRRPNILVIVADDLGYSDLGAFGGEIETPNIDALVREGRALTNFHAGATCSPTRSMLMSGIDHHLNGLGSMAEVTGLMIGLGNGLPQLYPFGTAGGSDGITVDTVPDGYAGYLNEQSLSMPEMLRDAGYDTYMTGKWHLAFSPIELSAGAPVKPHPESFPGAKGFERSFVLLDGGGAHFAPPVYPTPQDHGTYAQDDVTMPAADLPPDFYSTTAYTDRMIGYIGERTGKRKPFFAYLAYTAPHWPLQAPQAEIEAQRGRYDEGYEIIRARRIERMKALGILPRSFQANPGLPSVSEGGTGKKHWSELSADEKQYQARLMEVYAAMVHTMDANIGRVIDHLKNIGEYDNTFILFMSDNGAEGSHFLNGTQNVDNTLENVGKPGSMADYGERWAEVSAAPFRLWKSHTGAEGGTSVPAIVKMPNQRHPRATLTALTHVTDVLPTVLELARVPNPGDDYMGRSVHPMSGVSLVRALRQRHDVRRVRSRDAVLADELFMTGYVRKGKWKLSRVIDVQDPTDPYLFSPLVPLDELPWKLFDMSRDRGETTDLAASHPDVVEDLLGEWEKYVQNDGVILPDYALTPPRNAVEP